MTNNISYEEVTSKALAYLDQVITEADAGFEEGGEAYNQAFNKLDGLIDHITVALDFCAKACTDHDEFAKKYCKILLTGRDVLGLRFPPAKSIRWYGKAIQAARKYHLVKDLVPLIGYMGIIYTDQGDVREAIKYYRKQLRLSRSVQDTTGEAYALTNLGMSFTDMGKPRLAIRYLEKALEFDRHLKDERGEATDIALIGIARMYQGDYQTAKQCFEKGLEYDISSGNLAEESYDWSNLSSVYCMLGDYQQALIYAQKALTIADDLEDTRGLDEALANVAEALIGQNRAQDAIGHLLRAQQIDKDTNDQLNLSISMLNMGKAYSKLEQYEEALKHLETALANFRKIGDIQSEGRTLCEIGIIYSHQCLGRQAEEIFDQAIKLASHVGDKPTLNTIYWHLGKQRIDMGDRKKGMQYMKKYIGFLNNIGHLQAEEYRLEMKSYVQLHPVQPATIS